MILMGTNGRVNNGIFFYPFFGEGGGEVGMDEQDVQK